MDILITMKYLGIFIIILLLNNSYLNSEECIHTKDRFNCVEYISNYDGDTIKVNIPNIHPLLGEKISIRVNGIDTAEIRTKDTCEKEMAYKAKNLVNELLKNSKRIDLINIKRGKYFRIASDVLIDGKSLSNILLKKNLAYKYNGGKKPNIGWCRRLPSSN